MPRARLSRTCQAFEYAVFATRHGSQRQPLAYAPRVPWTVLGEGRKGGGAAAFFFKRERAVTAATSRAAAHAGQIGRRRQP